MFEQWGDVDGGAVSVMVFMCVQLFSGLCVSRCVVSIAFIALERGLGLCGVCLETMCILIASCVCVGCQLWRWICAVHGYEASLLGACWVVCLEICPWCGVGFVMDIFLLGLRVVCLPVLCE